MAIDTTEHLPEQSAPGHAPPPPGARGPAHARRAASRPQRPRLAWRCWVDGAVLFVLRAATVLFVGEFAVHGLGTLPSGAAVSLVPGSRALFTNFFHWDAVRYVQIAQHGYVHRYDAVYFPLYPLMARALPFKATVAALMVSWVATYLFAVALTYYVRHCLRLERWAAVVSLALFAPASFFFFAAYPEPLEALALTVVLILVHKQRFGWAAVVAGLSTAAAPICAFFVIPIVVAMVRRRRFVLAVAAAAVSELGIVAYAAWLWSRFGHPLLFWSEEATPQWNRKLTYPFHGVVWSLDRILHGQLIGSPAYNGNDVIADLVNDVVAVAGTAALVVLVLFVWRRRASIDLVPALAVAAVAVAFNVCDATAGGLSPEALARHFLVVVPLYLVVAYLRRPEVVTGLVCASAALAVVAQTLYFHNLWFT